MVRIKLTEFQEEIGHYLGIPYWKNKLENGKIIKEGFLGGKGNCRQIASETIRLAQKQNIDLTKLSNQEFYNFQKKNHIGVDCSGLACQLFIFYGQLIGKKVELNIRRTSADMLTSSPLAKEIKLKDIQTGDLIRQKNGHHLLFIIDKEGDIINYIDSSREGRGVKFGQYNIKDKTFENQGIYRLFLFD